MREYDFKKLMVSVTIIFFMMPSLIPLADEVNEVASDINIKSGEKYEEVRFGDNNVSVSSISMRYMNPVNSINTVDNTNAVDNVGDKEEVQKKIEAMNDFKILKPKTEEGFEVALATPADSVREFTRNYISRGYSDPSDWTYFGGYLGNKQLGANVKYASDPFWGEKAAQHAFAIDYELSEMRKLI